MDNDIDAYWNKFLKASNLCAFEKYAGTLSFESRNFTGDAQLALVLSGKKTCFFSCYASYIIDNEVLPVAGEYYVVTGRNEMPMCIIEATGIKIVPFNEVTWDMAMQEGEDENLEAWRAKQSEYLKDEGDIAGFSFKPDMRLVFTEFAVVYR